jgi:hypothetical protein
VSGRAERLDRGGRVERRDAQDDLPLSVITLEIRTPASATTRIRSIRRSFGALRVRSVPSGNPASMSGGRNSPRGPSRAHDGSREPNGTARETGEGKW